MHRKQKEITHSTDNAAAQEPQSASNCISPSTMPANTHSTRAQAALSLATLHHTRPLVRTTPTVAYCRHSG